MGEFKGASFSGGHVVPSLQRKKKKSGRTKVGLK